MMMGIKRIAKKLYRFLYQPKMRMEISRLDLVSTSLANALRKTLFEEATLSSEEKVWIERIESLRKELSYSSTEVSMMDYGAGVPGLNLTEREMDQGRIVTKTVGDICRNASKSYPWSLLLFKLVREFRPSVCLEMGTAVGISAAYQAAALILNGKGHIVTLEGAESLALLATQNLQALGLNNVKVIQGRFQDTLDMVLNEQGPVDYVFIDGHHEEEATVAYFEQVLPFLSKKAVMVFDDISWSRGMKRAWTSIQADDRVRISVDLFYVGICIIDSGITRKQGFKIRVIIG